MTATGFPRPARSYRATFSTPPKLIDTDQTTDAPLLGNGDLGVAVLGGIGAMTVILHKNEFWSLGEARVKAMARLGVTVSDMAGASYAMETELGTAELNGTFTLGTDKVTTKSWVQADDTTNNRFTTQFTYAGAASKTVTVSFTAGSGNPYPTAVGAQDDTLFFDVRGDAVDAVEGHPTRRVRIAARAVGTAGTVTGGRLTFTLTPGRTVTLVTVITSNLDSGTFQSEAVNRAAASTDATVADQITRHRAWWDAFWGKSFVEIDDKYLEKSYYAALYLLASASRSNEAAPGLWGNWVMKDPGWNGGYTLNYNYEVPFHAAFPNNHVELADSYDAPIIDWLPKAQALAAARGWKGAYYRVHIGPLPKGNADTQEWNQKSTGAYAASNLIMHYQYTHDRAYAAKVYPTLREIATFWENYLVRDGDRYVIVNDAQHEGNESPQTNGIMSLGLVRLLFQGTIEIATVLGMDADRRPVWQERLDHLSPFPTYNRAGKTVFRYTEVGLEWNDGNSIGIQHIYPSGQIGLGSEVTLLQNGKNMVAAMARWSDGNGTNTFYPAAVRVGHDPTEILTRLRAWIQGNSYPNLHIHTGGGGLENVNTAPSTIAEMLVQSFQGKIRLFPVWPAGRDARFGDLRARGAFLVSSAHRGGAIPYARIVSEQGGPCTVVNPWSGKPVRLYRGGVDAGLVMGAELALPTARNEVLHLAPDGTSFAQIMTAMTTGAPATPPR